MRTYSDNWFICVIALAFIIICIIIYDKVLKNKTICNECIDDIDNEQLNNHYLNFKHIVDNLYYDALTHIVYIKNNTSDYYDVHVPYFASNGLPFKYNTETDELEEINIK